jgi:hypothetical protein
VPYLYRYALITASCLAATACSTTVADHRPAEFLDERTAATVTVVENPLVFSRQRSDLGANLNDFVTVVAVAIDRSGKVDYALITYVWATQQEPDRAASGDSTVVLAADDRRITLDDKKLTARDLGVSVPVHAPSNFASAPHIARIDLATLRFISAAHSLSVQSDSQDEVGPYELFDDNRPALARFVQFMQGARP